ncbi:hypothetical protein C2S52_010724 [Perilla frutescens var. hirtella]|nr:hypothetical protein C2S52_010724 [Perilla frutescens var. hirtella]
MTGKWDIGSFCGLIKLTSAKHGFLASMEVGSESMDQVLYMDTGSSLLWIHCVPCKLHAPEPLFDPKKSASFEVEDCVTSNNICRQTGNVRLEYKKKGHYQYTFQYGKGYSEGYLARETFKFVTSTKVMEKIVFGCNKVSELNQVNGVLGLAANRLSLISQRKASRFSYCFGNISDPSNPYSFLARRIQMEYHWDFCGGRFCESCELRSQEQLTQVNHEGILNKMDELISKVQGIITPANRTIKMRPKFNARNIELTCFDSIDPYGWIVQDQDYFDYNDIFDEERDTAGEGVRMVSMDEEQKIVDYMDGFSWRKCCFVLELINTKIALELASTKILKKSHHKRIPNCKES